jgi:hypothetical protein
MEVAPMYVGRNFQTSDPGESELYGLDFANDLGPGETIIGVTWYCETARGADPSPASHLEGPSTIGGTVVSQRISGLLAGVNYRLRALVTTSAGNSIDLYSYVACVAPS